ncbi:hypothetical protein E2C01_001202 [Portunus trituberculatus]|uniref:Uncharacterized protein n=1 Tax=Portunus trituberculatus TaxID=210409 RepID=A0A5B7CLZ9_PORTR|nr:hypothetical protein [Portunus trituberculatus]
MSKHVTFSKLLLQLFDELLLLTAGILSNSDQCSQLFVVCLQLQYTFFTITTTLHMILRFAPFSSHSPSLTEADAVLLPLLPWKSIHRSIETQATTAPQLFPDPDKLNTELIKKLKITKCHEGGEGANFIAKTLQLPQSTVSIAIKQAASVKKVDDTASTLMVKMLRKKREPTLEEMETQGCGLMTRPTTKCLFYLPCDNKSPLDQC